MNNFLGKSGRLGDLGHELHMRVELQLDDDDGDGDSECCNANANGGGLVEERPLREVGGVRNVFGHGGSFRLRVVHYRQCFSCEG